MRKTGLKLVSVLLFSLAMLFAGCKKDEVTKTAPVLTTSDVTAITQTTAKCGGNITSDGDDAITARGVVWSNVTAPTLETCSGKSVDGTGSGVFTSNITSLGPNTTYYVRAYATNSVATSYGDEKTFSTPMK